MNYHPLQNTVEEPIALRIERSHTRRTHEVPFIAGRRHFTQKNTRFRAAPMQHSCSHYTAICNQRVNKRIELRTHEQPPVAEHSGGTDCAPNRAQPHPPHTRGTFHRWPKAFDTEKHKVSCCCFPPNTSPMQSCSHCTAICDQRINKRKKLRTHEQPPVAEHSGGTDYAPNRAQPHPPHTRGTFHRRPKALYTEKHKVSCCCFPANTSPMQHSCSHYIAICDQRVNKRIELRTHEQPLVAEHSGGTDCAPNRAQPHPPHTRGTFHRRPKALYTEKHKVSCCCFPPNTSPMQHSLVSRFSLLCDVNSHTTIH